MIFEHKNAHCFYPFGDGCSDATCNTIVIYIYIYLFLIVQWVLHSDHKDDGADGAICSTENSLSLSFLVHMFLWRIIG